jgi:TRAP-type mannitol/chloroaromatic compound transport system permease large subunit
MSTLLIGEILAVLMFVGIIATVLLGYPVAFTLAGTALIFAGIGWLFGAFDFSYFNSLPLRYWGVITNDVLIAVPLFVFMGVMLERSRIAESLLAVMGESFGRLPGGLGISTVLVGTVLAASTGIVGATVATMGLISLPAMLAAGYDKRLASGLICASGSLAQIIPPSTILIFLAVILQSAYSQVQMAQGNFTPETVSVGQIFAGAFLPGLVLSLLYVLWVAFIALTRPQHAPAVSTAGPSAAVYSRIVTALLPPMLLVIAVLGSIIAGIATPTESASVGAVGAILLAMIKLVGDHYSAQLGEHAAQRAMLRIWLAFLAALIGAGAFGGGAALLNITVAALVIGLVICLRIAPVRQRLIQMTREVCSSTLVITAMVFVLFLGASVFSLVFTRLGGEELVHAALAAMPGGAAGALLAVMAVMFVLGFFLDPFEIIFIMIPIAGPVLLKMGVDPIWLAVLIGVNLQTSYLTPPFGFCLFFLRGVAPPSVTTMDIYRGAVPFVAIQVTCLGIIWWFPAAATWLPNWLYP